MLGWPTHVIGVSNEAGEYACCGLAMTSSMEAQHITDMMESFAGVMQRETKRNVHKPFVMSDQELAYRQALKVAFKGDNLMCYFHVKSAAREY